MRINVYSQELTSETKLIYKGSNDGTDPETHRADAEAFIALSLARDAAMTRAER